ncbi:AraC family transcriptional regulator [Treponema parvum]|uniref:AraC family transcriptional regulator n=1 Tax=Treponema parvum TaxID=138851 RepID=A0A975F067_9SPIR|nr:helix-turn-helix domain-containing protein [Treponema parvum]QTQ11943.1 AraC family transcriptional regulator [Treponema parvum]
MIREIDDEKVIDLKREANYSLRFAINSKEYPQVHNFYEFSLLIRGSFIMTHEGKRYKLNAGDLILTRPGTIHSKIAIVDVESEHINLAFLKSTMNEVSKYLYSMSDEEFFKDKDSVYHLSPNYLEFINNEMSKLSPVISDDPNFEKSHLRWLLVELLHNVINLKNNSAPSYTNLPVWLSKLIVEFDDPNRIGKGFCNIVAKVGLSSEHIIRTFKKYLNYTPLQYYNMKRLRIAAHMLSHTDVPIAVISENLGFCSAAYFYKKFKEAYGTTPRSYRLNCGMIEI